jgi:hypothetical protein
MTVDFSKWQGVLQHTDKIYVATAAHLGELKVNSDKKLGNP